MFLIQFGYAYLLLLLESVQIFTKHKEGKLQYTIIDRIFSFVRTYCNKENPVAFFFFLSLRNAVTFRSDFPNVLHPKSILSNLKIGTPHARCINKKATFAIKIQKPI